VSQFSVPGRHWRSQALPANWSGHGPANNCSTAAPALVSDTLVGYGIALAEEEHLRSAFGEDYVMYFRRVRRYL
jgi:hypothetical protein